VSSPYSDLERPPLRETALRRGLLRPGGLWTDLRYLANTGSTNADAAAAARQGAPEGLLIVADEQTQGRGRLARQWQSPPRAGIAMSVLLRPGDAVAERGWSPITQSGYAFLPLLAGVALVETVRRLAEVNAVLKWPNDLLIDDKKAAGILAESVGDGAVVVGVGLNVTLRADELPRPDATSLQLAGSSCVDRDPLLRALVRGIESWYLRWRDADGDAVACGLLESYRFHCATIGANVSVSMPGGADVVGVVTGVDDEGRLVIGDRTVAAGDVVHLRSN
jgi:BirA family transcriptional regulator, biotin operon repressor / biotin---[acetyl-CoA-carboxylase] ligase